MTKLPKDVVCPVCGKEPSIWKGKREWSMYCALSNTPSPHHVGFYGSSARWLLIARRRRAFGKGESK